MKKLIIIPAYNEQDNIQNTVNTILMYCPEYDYIIINDCSTDHTYKVCKENGFNIIDLPINLGIGGAMQTGYRYAYNNDYEIAVQVDGDGQHNPSEITKIEEALLGSKSDLVIGSRFLEKKGFQSTISRRLGICYFSRLIRLLTGTKITDPTSGFRICDRRVIEFFAKCYPKDYPEPESIVTLLRMGYKVNEVDTIMNERSSGQSSIKRMRIFYYMIKVSLAILIDVIKPENWKERAC